MPKFSLYSDQFKDFKSGSKQAAQLFYEKLHPIIYWYVFRLCNDASIASDLTQEAFYKTWKARDRIRDESHLSGYLHLAARCEWVNLHRDHEKWQTVQKDLSYSIEEEYDFTNDPEVVKTNALAVLHDAIDRLPAQQKKVIQLLYFEKKSVRTVADELSLNEQTVRNHHAKAKDTLKGLLPGRQFIIL